MEKTKSPARKQVKIKAIKPSEKQSCEPQPTLRETSRHSVSTTKSLTLMN